MGEMEVQEPAATEADNKTAPPEPQPGEMPKAASGRGFQWFGTAGKKQVPFYLVTGVVLLLGSVILGCLMFIEQQSKEQALLTAPPVTQTANQPEATETEDVAPARKPHRSARPKAHEAVEHVASPVPQGLPSELYIKTQPQGAQIQIDGRSNGEWITPYVAEQLTPGKHTISVSKPGYRLESRTFELPAGKRLSVVIPMTELGALVTISSQPSDASVVVDGVDTGRVTPTQIPLVKGTHTFTLRKPAYFDATSSVSVSPGQNSQLSLELKPIRSDLPVQPVKKLRKLYGKPPAGMGWVQIRTVPKGAQIAINRRPLESPAPADFLLEIGDYEVSLSLNGYKSVQRVIHVEDGSRIEIQELLERSD